MCRRAWDLGQIENIGPELFRGSEDAWERLAVVADWDWDWEWNCGGAGSGVVLSQSGRETETGFCWR